MQITCSPWRTSTFDLYTLGNALSTELKGKKNVGGSKPAPYSVDRRMGDTAPLVAALNRELAERLNGR